MKKKEILKKDSDFFLKRVTKTTFLGPFILKVH